MIGLRWMGVGLLVLLASVRAMAQPDIPGPPSHGPGAGVELLPPVDLDVDPAESVVDDVFADSAESDATVCLPPLDEFLGYRYSASSMDWMIGGGDQFGMFSLDWDHYQKRGEETGVGAGVKIHFLDGPVRTEMPPRLFDFSIALQSRKQLGDFSFDVAASVMASSDFEGSAREGIRFPGHAVGYYRLRKNMQLVFGIDYLDRGDLRLLPVGGLILNPHPDVRLELVFPRPSVVINLTGKERLYFRGELGGGTWDIRRFDIADGDVATYRDLRFCIGLETIHKDGSRSAFEIGYLFDRHLEYATGIGDYRLDDTAMLRLVQVF